jgi:hypothetical protein
VAIEGGANMNTADNTMTVEQAYRAMLAFLQREVELTESTDLADLVSEYRLGADGLPRDPTLWEEWLEAVNSTRRPREGEGPSSASRPTSAPALF